MDRIYVNAPEFLGKDREKTLWNYINDNTIDLNLEYDSDFKSAKILRDIAHICTKNLGMEEKWASRIILICDELNNNAVEYGSLKGEKNYMRLKLQKTSKDFHISIEVEDTGHGSHAKKSAHMEQIRTEKLQNGFEKYHGIRGRGLFMIITNLVDNLYFKDSSSGGLVVGIEKTITF